MNTAISESDQLYSKIFVSAPDGLIITDLKTGRVLDANPAACVMCERTEAVDALLTITSQPGHGTKLTLIWPGTLK